MYGNKGHGYAFQAVTDAFGLIVDLSGPYVGRYNDHMMRLESRIEERLELVLTAEQLPTINLLTDKLYGAGTFVRPLYRGLLVAAAQQENNVNSAIRTSGEWPFGKIAENWQGLFLVNGVKPLESPHGKNYALCALLTNAHTILNGSQSQSYFSRPAGSCTVNLDFSNTFMEDYFSFI
jgi:hypothetical protein